MNITREEVIKRVNSKDHEWFYQLYDKYNWGKNDGEVEIVYDQNYGDGNDYIIAFKFVNHNFFVQLEGTYSSWDSPYWSDVSFAVPYEYTETRYRSMSLDEIRDQKIDNVLNQDNEN